MALLTTQQMTDLGLTFGENVRISDRASIYNGKNIILGSNVRIDDFAVLSAGEGGIEIRDNVHIAIYTSLMGTGKITIGDFSNFSSRVAVYSSNDDYSGNSMTSPLIPDEFKGVYNSDVIIEEHAIIGCGTVILPGVHIRKNVSIGALSLVRANSTLNSNFIYAGVPVSIIGLKSTRVLDLAELFKAGKSNI